MQQHEPISQAPAEGDATSLRSLLEAWADELGFAAIAVSDRAIDADWQHLQDWLAQDFHGEMHYMSQHAELRRSPSALVPDTLSVLSVRMHYLPPDTDPVSNLEDSRSAYISRYALGRDYHKLIRKRLAQLAQRIRKHTGHGQFRALVDSAPVLERALAERAGLGWIGKNTMLIHPSEGSWFFLGEIFTDLPLQPDQPQTAKHCGSCTDCLQICPTDAFVGPYRLDARRCISYLTIEHRGSIPEPLREPMGNRVFGCDDCQLVCPWNKFAQHSHEPAFQPRHGLDSADLLDLFLWTEQEFLERTEGSAIRRIGYERWQRNLAVALGNAPADAAISEALTARRPEATPLVQEHVDWALERQHLARAGGAYRLSLRELLGTRRRSTRVAESDPGNSAAH